MKILVIGSRSQFTMGSIAESMLGCTSEDTLMVMGVVPVDDLVARYAYNNSMKLESYTIDTQLHGTNARYHMATKLMESADRLVTYEQESDEFVQSIKEIAESKGIEVISIISKSR